MIKSHNDGDNENDTDERDAGDTAAHMVGQPLRNPLRHPTAPKGDDSDDSSDSDEQPTA